jgi:hypothetical protein
VTTFSLLFLVPPLLLALGAWAGAQSCRRYHRLVARASRR